MLNAMVMVAVALLGQADVAAIDDLSGIPKTTENASHGQEPGGASEVFESDLNLEVRRLVRRLDSRELAEREAAEKALIEIGPKVLDLLPPVDEQTTAEVKQRLDRVKIQLQKQQAQSAAAGSTFTLVGQRMTLEEIFKSIEEQTGNKITFGGQGAAGGAPPVRLTVDYTDTPFWPTFDEILDRAGLTVNPFSQDGSLAVAVARGEFLPRSAAAAYAGPFRFEAVTVEASRDLRRQGNSSMAVTMEIAWEPRFRPISLQQRMSEICLVDDAGEPVILAARQAQLEMNVSAEMNREELRIPLEAPPRGVRKIAKLKGRMSALMQGKAESFEFDDLMNAENVEKRAAGVTVVLERVRKNRDVWEIRVITRFDDAEGALASHRNWVFDNPAKLITPEGEDIPNHGWDSTRQMENEVGIAYFFGIDGDLEDYKFVYETAGSVLSATFDYELSDITLP